MIRTEALKLIGKNVKIGTLEYGDYIGTLINITDSKPFRANVKIKEVLDLPYIFEHYPMKKDKIVSIGAANIYEIPDNTILYGYRKSILKLVSKDINYYKNYQKKIEKMEYFNRPISSNEIRNILLHLNNIEKRVK